MISGDSRILVYDLGYVQIKDVPQGSYIIWNGSENIGATVTKVSSQPLFNIELTNGKNILVTSEQKFETIQKRVERTFWTKAKDLTSSDYIYFSGKSYDFDYLEDTSFKFLNSRQLGTLVGFIHCLTSGEYLDIPTLRTESIKELESLLNLTQTTWSKEQYFHRTPRLRYTISEELKTTLEKFKVKEYLPKSFWTSKPFMEGFLKVLFTFGMVGKEMLIVKANKESFFLKEIQDYLALFGINSSYIKGLKVSSLVITKNSCYRFAHNIGVFNPEILLSGVDFKKVLVYKDNTTSDMRYGNFHRSTEVKASEVYEITGDTFMANGLVLGTI